MKKPEIFLYFTLVRLGTLSVFFYKVVWFPPSPFSKKTNFLSGILFPKWGNGAHYDYIHFQQFQSKQQFYSFSVIYRYLIISASQQRL